ncbi:MAG TPA: hypothetical protein VD838_20585, partial [Anaeromyxobacteraceae bacterium]|nr:hypothetical protein [Anaeromyxobacteraceae bacterium]
MIDLASPGRPIPEVVPALEEALRDASAAIGWPFGAVWLPRADGAALECVAAWTPLRDAREPLERFTRNLALALGEGLPG